MSEHLLSCECGQSVVVRTQQAGGTVDCQCGAVLDVPGLRDLRELPLVSVENANQARKWSSQRGVFFALGFGIFLISLFFLGLFGYLRSKLDLTPPTQAQIEEIQKDLSKIKPVEAWEIWSELRHRVLYRRGAPLYLENRARADWLEKLLVAAGCTAGLGAIAALGSTFIGRRR